MKLLDDDALEHVADYFRALSEPLRLKILNALRGRPRNVSELTRMLACSQANVSKHLAVLRHAGLVEARRDGVNVFYRIADPAVFVICETVCDSLERTIDTRRTGLSEGRQALKAEAAG